MLLYQPPLLTEEVAARMSKEWVRAYFRAPAPSSRRGQMWILLERTASRCAAESLTKRETEDQFEARLQIAHDILWSAQHAAAPAYVTKYRVSDDDITEEEKKKIENAERYLWRRRDPQVSYIEGFDSDQNTNIEKPLIDSIIARYMGNYHLSDPIIDWVFLDITITNEISLFGEHLKQQWAPGKVDSNIFHSHYFKAKGNIAKMKLLDPAWKRVLRGTALWIFWKILFPAGTLWITNVLNWTVLFWILFCLFFLSWSCILAGCSILFGQFVFRKLTGRSDKRTKMYALWDQMYYVWKELGGPVVHPTMLKNLMTKAAAEGAGWDTVSWSLIDRAIARHPTEWIVRLLD
jgi:hypothetical protein